MSKEPLRPEEIQQIQHLLNYVQEERFYELFEVSSTATTEEIQSAYYKISRQWHPDRFFRRDTGEHAEAIDEIFMGITTAYRTLSDIQERTLYDRTHTVETTTEPSEETVSRRPSYRRGKRRRRREKQKDSTSSKVKTLKEKRRDAVLNSVRQNLTEQRRRAVHFFTIGSKDYEDGFPLKALSSLHLACKMDPENQEYKKLYQEVKKLARSARAVEYFTEAENAESFQNYQKAISCYRKAVEYEVEDARAYARLAYLLEKLDPDSRESIRLMQIAVQKEGDNVEYRCILGEVYAREGLRLNARREFQKVLQLDKSNQRAKNGLKSL